MWQHSSRCGVFLEGVSLTLAEKKAKQKQKPMPYMHQDVTFFRKRFAAFDGEKGDTGTPALYGKNVSTPSYLHGKLTDRRYL